MLWVLGLSLPPAALVCWPAQVAALQRQLADANASAVEIRAASHALIDLVGDATALQAMLNCYSHKVQLSQALLLKQHAAGEGLAAARCAAGCMGMQQGLLCETLHMCELWRRCGPVQVVGRVKLCFPRKLLSTV